MKYLLSILAASCMILSCTSDNKIDSVDSTSIDSVKAVPKFSQEEQNKVLGNLKFGVSKKQFKIDEAKFRKNSNPNKYETEYRIGDYFFYDLDGEFHHDSLYSVFINGRYIKYDNYDAEAPDQVQALTSMLTQKFGQPSLNNAIPEWTDIKKGYYRVFRRWTVGKKRIAIAIQNREIYYTVDLIIDLPAMVDLVKSNNESEANSTASKSKDVF